MSKVRFKGPVEEMSGTLYDAVFKRSHTGKIIVAKRPDMSNVEWSEAQQAQRGRFALANAYVKAVKANPEVWAAYQKRAKKQKNVPGTWHSPITVTGKICFQSNTMRISRREFSLRVTRKQVSAQPERETIAEFHDGYGGYSTFTDEAKPNGKAGLRIPLSFAAQEIR